MPFRWCLGECWFAPKVDLRLLRLPVGHLEACGVVEAWFARTPRRPVREAVSGLRWLASGSSVEPSFCVWLNQSCQSAVSYDPMPLGTLVIDSLPFNEAAGGAEVLRSR